MDEVPEETCFFCRFFGGQSATDVCRRHAPVVTGGMMSNLETVWPLVGEAQWCGDFEREAAPRVEAIPMVVKCTHCDEGAKMPAGMTDDWLCPKCGANCMPF